MELLSKSGFINQPERVLSESGLMAIIKSEEYQIQMACFLNAYNAVNSHNSYLLSSALRATVNWVEHVLWDTVQYDNEQKVRKKKSWRDVINFTLRKIAEKDREQIIFWIAQYSLLVALRNKTIAIRYLDEK